MSDKESSINVREADDLGAPPSGPIKAKAIIDLSFLDKLRYDTCCD